MAEAHTKDPSAFLTIGELSGQLGVPQHILRYWELRFPQLRPLQRAGNRRYYRPADVDLVGKIHSWLTVEGYTVKGVQKLLAGKTVAPPAAPAAPVQAAPHPGPDFELAALVAIRDRLARALAEDASPA